MAATHSDEFKRDAVHRSCERCHTRRVDQVGGFDDLFDTRQRRCQVDDLDWIAGWISDYAGASSAAAKINEIEQTIRSLALTPHKGSRRDEIAPGLRAIPAGRKGEPVSGKGNSDPQPICATEP